VRSPFIHIAILIIIMPLAKNSPYFSTSSFSSSFIIKILILINPSLSTYILYASSFAAYFVTAALSPFKKSP
jgi:predicted membrane protein